MITTLLGSQTLAVWPNSRLKTPMVPGPQTSCVIRMSAWAQTLSPAWTRALPAARASIFSVKVINLSKLPDWHSHFNTQTYAENRRRTHTRGTLFSGAWTVSPAVYAWNHADGLSQPCSREI